MAAAVTMRVGRCCRRRWLSSTPVTVTVCATFQLAGGEGSEAGATVPSVVSELLSAMVTLAVGWRVQHHGEASPCRRPRWSPGRRSAPR